MTDADPRKTAENAGRSLLKRLGAWIEETRKIEENTAHRNLKHLILWFEKEAHLLGADVEAEVESILAKLRPRLP